MFLLLAERTLRIGRTGAWERFPRRKHSVRMVCVAQLLCLLHIDEAVAMRACSQPLDALWTSSYLSAAVCKETISHTALLVASHVRNLFTSGTHTSILRGCETVSNSDVIVNMHAQCSLSPYGRCTNLLEFYYQQRTEHRKSIRSSIPELEESHLEIRKCVYGMQNCVRLKMRGASFAPLSF